MTAEAPDLLQDMDAAQLRELAASLMHTLGRTRQELTASKTLVTVRRTHIDERPRKRPSVFSKTS